MRAIKVTIAALNFIVASALSLGIAATAQTTSAPGGGTTGGSAGAGGAASPGSTAPPVGVNVGPSAGTSLGGNNPAGVNIEEINKGNVGAAGGIATGPGLTR